MKRSAKEKERHQRTLLLALLLSFLVHLAAFTLTAVFGDRGRPRGKGGNEITLDIEPRPAAEPVRAKMQATRAAPARPPVRPRQKLRRPGGAPYVKNPSTAEISTGAGPSSGAIPSGLEGPPATAEQSSAPRKNKIKVDLDWKGFETLFAEQAEVERDQYALKSLETRRGAGSFRGEYADRVLAAMGGGTGNNGIGNRRGWVMPGNQEILGAERQKAFRSYLDVVHDKIHPLFADGFLDSLATLPASDPLNDFSLQAILEFEILTSGRLSDARLVRSSGNSIFDAAALDSVYRAAPYARPPKEILSWNDRVYFRWSFYRNTRKCGPFNAEPYILTSPDANPEAISADKLMIDDG